MCLTDCGVKNSQSNWENTTLFVTLIHGDRFSIQTISLLLVQINDMQLLLAWLLFESQTESWQRSQDQRQTVLYYYIYVSSLSVPLSVFHCLPLPQLKSALQKIEQRCIHWILTLDSETIPDATAAILLGTTALCDKTWPIPHAV